MYGKIYECTFTGSMMGKGALTFSVWSYVIAHTGPDSLVEINPRLVATLLGEDEAKVEESINYLQEPDPKSRSKTHQGRRLIKRGEYLYYVPNAAKYRGLPNDQARKDYFAQKQREHREGITTCQTGMSKLSKNVKQAEAEAEAEAESIKNGLSASVGERFNEWMVFRRGLGKAPKNWQTMFAKQAQWLKQFPEPEQLEILDQSMRNGWQGLFQPKQDGGSGRKRDMSSFEIKERVAAITQEISKVFKSNGSKRVEGDGIDELKRRRDELQKELTK